MKCVQCCLAEVGAGDRPQSEGHVSVRWDRGYRVYDDEGLITGDRRPVYEVDAVNGWAIRYPVVGPASIDRCSECGTPDLVMAYVEYGTYHIERR